MALLNPLRPITQRLNSTPVEELPRYAGFLEASLRNCAKFLQSPESQKSEASIQTHKLTTRISALLQDKTQEGRFTGTILAKALLEAAGTQTLTASGLTWVRGLISCLSKPDPPQVKKIVVITITRALLLSAPDQAIVREITTPSLPPFLTACLNIIRPLTSVKDGVEKQVLSPLLSTVFQCWVELMKNFPSTFRPFVPSIRAITLNVLSHHNATQDVKDTAYKLFATLHFCAPKDNAVTEWTQSTKLILEASHQAADVVFRSIIEDWTGTIARQAPKVTSKQAASVAKATGIDAVGLEKWTGLHAGLTRMTDLVNLLNAMLTCDHAQAVRVPVAEFIDLTARFAAVLPPTASYALREHKEIGREERDELYTNLPRLHSAILTLYGAMATTYGRAIVSASKSYLGQMWDIFESESYSVQIRSAMYNSTKELLQHSTILLNTSDSSHIATLIRSCCSDLTLELGVKVNTPTTAQHGALKLDNPAAQKKVEALHPQSALVKGAWGLLPVILTCVPSSLVASNSRTEIDRTAILLGHKEALLASVMNPSTPRKGMQQSASVLPFLTQADRSSLASEALLRPRQPALRTTDHAITTEDDGEQSESMSEDDRMALDQEFQAASDEANGHAEDGLSKDLVVDEAHVKKRDHAAVDDTSVLSAVESSKKAKTEPSGLKDDHNLELASGVGLSGDDGTLENIQVSSKAHSLVEQAPVGLTTQYDQSSNAATEAGHVQLSSYRRQAQDEDSDDSDIPQIDTALSSEEEDDEDEELEG